VGPTCQTPLSAPGPPGSAPLPCGCPATHRARALNALSGPHAGVPTAQRRSDRLSEITDVASPHPVPTAPSPLSEAASPPCPNPAAVRPSDTVVRFVHSEHRPSSPLAVLHPWSVELTSPSLLPVAGPLPATVAPTSSENATAEPVLSPSPSTRSSGELFSPSPCPAGSLTAVGARPPPFAPPPPLWRCRRPRRDACPESGNRSGMRRAVAGRTGRGRPGKHRPRAAHTGRASAVAAGRTRTMHMGRADAVSVGHAPLCNWADREFGPVTLDLVFLISEYIQILANLKFCVGFI
jgi:hypothetical protein